MHLRNILSLGMALSAAAAFTPVVQAQYVPQDTSSATSENPYPVALSHSGLALATALDMQTYKLVAMIWDGERPRKIPSPPGVAPFGINDFGAVVGSYNVNGQPVAFRWTPGGTLENVFDPYGYTSSTKACAISNSGFVAGTVDLLSQPRAVLLDPVSGLVVIPLPPGGMESRAQAVNEAGDVVGNFKISVAGIPYQRPFLYSQGQVQELPLPVGWKEAFCADINAGGTIVGWGWATSTVDSAAIYWDSQGYHLLPEPVGTENSSALKVNDQGQILGAYKTPAYWKALNLIWDGGTFLLLDDLLEPGSPWKAEDAVDINNAGQVLAYGFYEDTSGSLRPDDALVLSPMTGPLALSSPAPGDAGSLSQTAVTRANLGDAIALFGSASKGSSPLGSCTGVNLDLAAPKLIGTLSADSTGLAMFQNTIPLAAAQRLYFLQAANLTTCELSDRIPFWIN